MAEDYNKKAVVKLDPPETNSTGGMVVDILSQAGRASSDWKIPEGKEHYFDNSEYAVVECNDECSVGWIYTDKTHTLIAP